MKQLVKRLQTLFNRMKIKKQLYSIYLISIFVPILLIGGFLIGNNSRLLLNYHRDLIESDNLRTRTILFEITSQIYNISEVISFDDGLENLLTKEYLSMAQFEKLSTNYKIVENYALNYAEVEDIAIYTDNPGISDYKRFHPVTDEITESEWYKIAYNQSSVSWIPIMLTDKYDNNYWNLSLVRKIPLAGSPYHAVLVIKISNNYLKSRIDTNDYYTELSLNDEVVFYSNIRDRYGVKEDIPINYNDPYYQYTGSYVGNYEHGNIKYLISVSSLAVYQSSSKVYICTLNTGAYKDINKILFTCGLIIFVAIVLPGIVIHYFAHYFTGRVEILREEMHKASNEDYNIIHTFYGQDELYEAFADLEIMVQKIKKKDAQMYESRINEQKLKNKQQEMEFKMLASQINPHFLYNTLETIRMKALTTGNREVANSIKLLGKSMRYVLENTGTAWTTLKNELDYIQIYLQIQKMRFDDKVNYELIIGEEVDVNQFEILPLLLQPIVENAIIHGLEQVESNGRIKIEVTRKDINLCITISDNGCGMDEEELQALMKKIQTPKSNLRSSIGLYNIQQRIRLCYGENYGMSIKSIKGVETVTTLELPPRNYSVEEDEK